MATEDNLVKLKGLRALAERIKNNYVTQTDFDELDTTVQGLVTEGGEPNVIETIKVNNSPLPVSGKAVNITVPTSNSQLTNGAGYQTAAQVQSAIAAAKHASFEVVDEIPTATTAKDNVLYLYKNPGTGYYDIYAKVTESDTAKVVQLDEVNVDLSGYVKGPSSTVTASTVAVFDGTTGKLIKSSGYTIAKSVPDDAKFTDTVYTHPTSTGGGSKTSGLYKITTDEYGHVSAATLATGTDIKNLNPYTVVTHTANGLMSYTDKIKLDGIEVAQDADVESMLEEVFGS